MLTSIQDDEDLQDHKSKTTFLQNLNENGLIPAFKEEYGPNAWTTILLTILQAQLQGKKTEDLFYSFEENVGQISPKEKEQDMILTLLEKVLVAIPQHGERSEVLDVLLNFMLNILDERSREDNEDSTVLGDVLKVFLYFVDNLTLLNVADGEN